jgi:hypothetical protein
MTNKRTVYRVDIPKLKNYAARMAGNGLFMSGHQAAVMFLSEVMFAQKGTERRELTPDECSNLINQGGFK